MIKTRLAIGLYLVDLTGCLMIMDDMGSLVMLDDPQFYSMVYHYFGV